MNPEVRQQIDEFWLRLERRGDLTWVTKNLHVFWPAAFQSFAELGRGVVVVDTTTRAPEGGNPFGYIPQDKLPEIADEDTQHMVAHYEPTHEFVIWLLKFEGNTSTYRIPVPETDLSK